MTKKEPAVVLSNGSDTYYRHLWIEGQEALSIARYAKVDGEDKLVIGQPQSSRAFDSYYVFMHGDERAHGHLVNRFPKDNYLDVIRAVKDALPAWLFRTYVVPKKNPPYRRKRLVALHDQARELLNLELRRHHNEWSDTPVPFLNYESGEACTTNGLGDYGFYAEARQFFGKRCVILSRARNGLYHIALADDPKVSFPFPKRNLEPVEMVTR